MSKKKFLSGILALFLISGNDALAVKKFVRQPGGGYSLRRNRRNAVRQVRLKGIKPGYTGAVSDKELMPIVAREAKSFSHLEFWPCLAATGILTAGGAGTTFHFASKKLCDDKRSGYLYLAEKLGLLSSLKEYVPNHEDYDVMSRLNSIMPVYDELCSFVSNLSLDFDPEKLEAKFGIKDTESEFYKSHVSDFNLLKSWTFKFKIGRQSELQIVDHIYVGDIGCSYSGNYKWRGTQFLKFENNSWEFNNGYGFSQPVPKVYENASDEQKKNLRCGDFRGLFKNLARDVISEWLLCMWIYPIYDDEGFFDCCIRREDSCLEFVSSLMK